MPKLIVLGDTHFSEKEPLHTAQQKFIEWFSAQDFNVEENLFLSLGDLFDKYNPSPKVNAMVIDFFKNKMKFKEKLVIAGNYKHEFDSIKKNWAIDVLSPINGVQLFKEPFQFYGNFHGLDILMLPWYSKTMFPNLGSMKEFYEGLEEDVDHDFVFGHICDQEMFGEKIDISHVKGKKVLGHIHRSNGADNFLGTPYPVRKDEANKQNRIMIIDVETKEFEYIQVPNFIDYYDVTYPEKFDLKDKAEICILDIYNAPSREIAQEHYKEYHIRKNGIHLVGNSDGTNNNDEKSHEIKSLLDYLNNFCIDKNVSEEQRQILFSVMGERE